MERYTLKHDSHNRAYIFDAKSPAQGASFKSCALLSGAVGEARELIRRANAYDELIAYVRRVNAPLSERATFEEARALLKKLDGAA